MNSFKLGWFLAKRNIQHSSKWVTFFTVFTILLLFLTVMVISGILVGLIQGSEVAFRDKYSGDVVVTPLEKKSKVERSGEIESALRGIDGVDGFVARYLAAGSIEANYLTRKSDDIANKKQVMIRGIDPDAEDSVTHLSENMLEGEYLKKEDASKYILVGKDVLAKYSIVSDVDTTALRDVEPGTRVRIAVGTSTPYEYVVKGIMKVKAGDLSSSVFMVDEELRKLSNKNISDVDEISVRVSDKTTPTYVKDVLVNNGFDKYAKIQTFDESLPVFVVNMKSLFGALGNAFGFILMVVAVTVLFIVIFINALTRTRQIGILKGIGINKSTILWSYIFQAILYAFLGSVLGVLIVFFLLVPGFQSHPIDFPFSDGILVADLQPTLIKVAVLIGAAFLAGLIPSWMVVKRNTLDAILGRN
ncbi:MAG: ABC-type transport system permease component LolE [Patescibacteria group bacterium]|nr:ABC-type transport system permease component LolE [Patescibacteria group bacterium]